MQHVLRAISGPHAGAIYVLGSRATIGRASDCEIQILHEGVSRHHAKLTREDDGTVTITDLSSDNGTFIEDARVERHVLRPGEVIRILRSRFTYEVQSEQSVTSAVFHRKVTSGDSLRQTLEFDDSLSQTPGGVAQGLPAGVVGDRGRPYSRPQAAAPALSGARPGAAASGRYSGYGAASPEDGVEVVVETPSVRRPTPSVAPSVDESAAFVRERWPQLSRVPVPPASDGLGAAQSGARGRRASQTIRSVDAEEHPSEGRPGEPPRTPSRTSSGTGSYGWHAPATRDAPASASGQPSMSVRTERVSAPPPAGGPSGRMASLAPTLAEADAEPSSANPSTATMPQASGGWVRLPRTLEAPGSMRQGSTLAGIPWVGREEGEEASAAGVNGFASSESPVESDEVRARKARTAEYGALGGPAHADVSAAADAALEVEPELDSMTTVPNVRRTVRPYGSAVPTQEVPSVDESETLVDEDLQADIRSRVTVTPGERTEKTGPIHATTEPDIPVARTRPPSIGYEDTLRFQRGEVPLRPQAAPDPVDEPEPSLGAELARHDGLERLVDILEYRELRLRALRGGAEGAPAAERCAALERVLSQRPLRGDDMAAMRRYHRFLGSFPARLTQRARGVSSTAEVEVEDISAGGAKIVLADGSLAAGDTVWLSIELALADHPHSLRPTAEIVVMKARVVWTRSHEAMVGLVFAGAPAYDVELGDELG